MKKNCVSFLMTAIIMTTAIGMAPISVSAHSKSHSYEKTYSSNTKKCSSYQDKNNNKKCDNCGKKKTSHHKNNHHYKQE